MAKNNKPRVSVIIPVYNVEKYLARCLDSMLGQTYDNYEIICVDDYSPDNCNMILADYERKYADKITVLHNERNMGLGKTRERGMEASTGEYLFFVDSDDYVKPDFISTYADAVAHQKYDVVIGGYVRDIDGKLVEHRAKESVWSLVTYTVAWAKMFRKAFITGHHVGFSESRCGEDVYFSMCLFCESPFYTVIDYAGYYYYCNRESITGKINYDNGLEHFICDIFDEFLSKYEWQSLSAEQRRIIEYNYVADMVHSLITYSHGCGIEKMRQKYIFFVHDLKRRFPDYRKNPYFGLFRPRGQTFKIRISVGVVMGLHKMHMDSILFDLISLI